MDDLQRVEQRLRRALARLPNEIAALAVDFSKQRFRHQAWLDTVPEKWAPRKRRRKGGKSKSQTLLVDTGRLRRSIRKIKADLHQVIIGTDVPYAQVHNEGATIRGTAYVRPHKVKEHTVKAHTRTREGRKERVKKHTVRRHNRKGYARKMNTKIPRRQFIGNSAALARTLERHIKITFTKALKG